MKRRVEVLAPAGRWDVLEAVLDAGADAVYLGAKRLHMRNHRSDYHFSFAQIQEAVELVHRQGRRIYVVVNALVGEMELDDARELLVELDRLRVDAVIVQDLATLYLAREAGISVPLHASTMMNVHHCEHALVLRDLGVTRIIPSRDICVSEIAEIAVCANIEVECFVHGDMCVAQSGQCSLSGVLYGKSANRGECLKPCRWDYDLVRLDEGETVGQVGIGQVDVRQGGGGHLLAIKDLCMLRHIPDLVHAGICSMKIEGRMRDAAYLHGLVRAYRDSVDAYYACPPAFRLEVAAIEQTYRDQVRAMSTLTLLGGASHRDHFDVTGQREPLFLSNGHREATMEEERLPASAKRTPTSAPTSVSEAVSEAVPACSSAVAAPELAVCVGNEQCALAALEAGADRVDFAAEVSQLDMASFSVEHIKTFIAHAHDRGAKVGLKTPRVTNARAWFETQWLLEHLADSGLDVVLVHHLGTLRLVRRLCPDVVAIADWGFNILNSAATALLGELGASRVTVSNEAGYDDLFALAERTPLPLEILAHGAVSGMLIDHCVIALHATPAGRKDVCRGPCRHVAFGLRDRCGEVRPIVADQYCRNHLLTARDLALLPCLDAFRLPSVRVLRIEGQYYTRECVAAVTGAYRLRLAAGDGDSSSWLAAWSDAVNCSPRPYNLGPFARSIVQSRSTAAVLTGAH